MADVKISQLTATTSIVDTDLVETSIDAGGGSYASRKITFSNLRKSISTLGSSDTNNVTIETDGTLVFNNDATVWEDLMVPGLSVGAGASAPDLVAFGPSGNLQIYAFDGGSTLEQVYFSVQMQHSWKLGSTIKPHVHWTPTTAGAGNVKWNFEYSWASFTGSGSPTAFPAPTTISVVQAASGIAWAHQLSALPDIDGTGQGLSSMLVCRLYRNPADVQDTYASDAAFLQFDVHYEMDTVGSRQPTSK